MVFANPWEPFHPSGASLAWDEMPPARRSRNTILQNVIAICKEPKYIPLVTQILAIVNAKANMSVDNDVINVLQDITNSHLVNVSMIKSY